MPDASRGTEPSVVDSSSSAFAELERSVHAALETYSNVHRGSGQNSLVTTHLFEQAREIVLEHLGLDPRTHTVVFSTPRQAEALASRLRPGSARVLSSQDIGLSLGVRALAVERRALPRGAPLQTGGGTARLVAPGWVVWAKAPDRFEAGTPAIVNVIAFAQALRLLRRVGEDAFRDPSSEERTASEILDHDELERSSGPELLAELRETLVGRGLRVPTATGFKPYINLDHGASTPTFAPIWDAARQALRQPPQVRRELVQRVASICADALGAPAERHDVIFTSNTTEAINLAAEGLFSEPRNGIRPVVVNTLLEHNSNELPWRRLRGVSLVRLPVDAEGFVSSSELEALLRAYNQDGKHGAKRVTLVAVSGASNVLGVSNDLAELSRIAHRYGARVLVDAAQLVAHRRVAMEEWGIDVLAFSAHKVYAPFGTGVLVARKGLLRFGPTELELIRASGEENVAGIAALGKALVLLQRIGLDAIQEGEQALVRRALRGLAQVPGLTVHGIADPNSPRFVRKGGVIAFEMRGMMSDRVARALAERGGIGVRFGCHCAHLLIKHLLHISPLLALVQGLIVSLFPRLALPGVTRISLGLENSAEEIDTAIHVLDEIARGPRTGLVGNPFTRPRTAVEGQIDDFAQAVAERVYAPVV
jgi:selenocysteine lyase/cysteine desulfurase